MVAQVVVIGGGPAGLAAGIAAAQAGFSVLIAEPGVDRRAGRCDSTLLPSSDPGARAPERPIDKCCGEGLLPPAVGALEALGLPHELIAVHGHQLAGIRFHTPHRHAAATFVGSVGFGMRRTTLHTLLTERAEALGIVRVAETARLLPQGVAVGSWQYAPQWIVGADGAQSASRRAAGLDGGRVASRRFAIRQHFELGPGVATPLSVEVFWLHRGKTDASGAEADGSIAAQAYVTPVAPGRVGIAVLSSHRMPSMTAALALFPALAPLLQGAMPVSTPRGAVTTHLTLARVHRANFALVGDASGGVDAITGDGLALALQQAVALGKALAAGDLESYGSAHARLLRPARLMSRALLAMGSHPSRTAASMVLLGHVPGLFNHLLRSHARFVADPTLGKPYPTENTPWHAART